MTLTRTCIVTTCYREHLLDVLIASLSGWSFSFVASAVTPSRKWLLFDCFDSDTPITRTCERGNSRRQRRLFLYVL